MTAKTTAIEITAARREDERAIRALLAGVDLPVEESALAPGDFFVARREARLAGVVALEVHGQAGLLRSLAVEPESRGQGLADRLVERALGRARERGVETVWLLTTSAASYFARWGFRAAPRGDAPAELREHPQFRGLCPSTAACMRRELAWTAHVYPRGSLPLAPDVPGSRCAAVALEHAELTWYEIDPGARFERHAHDVDQITLVLEGELRFELDDRPPIRLGPGEAVAIPPGVAHAVVAGATTARAVDAWSRGAAGTRARNAGPSGDPTIARATALREIWLDRGFPAVLPVERLPSILERLRGTAARLDEAVRGVPRDVLTRRPAGKWSALEHVGHLGDLEPLLGTRLDDLEARRDVLHAADLENRATWQAGHDQRDVDELLRRFRDERERLVRRIEGWDGNRLARRAIHPRLKRPMSTVELAHFVAEHDDHHLASIRALLRDADVRPA